MTGLKGIIESIASIAYMLAVSAGLYFGSAYTLKSIHDKVQKMALEKSAGPHVNMSKMTEILTGGKPDF